MFNMILPTCSQAEKGAWHLVWSDLGVLRRRRAGMVFKGRKRFFLKGQTAGDGNLRAQRGRNGI